MKQLSSLWFCFMLYTILLSTPLFSQGDYGRTILQTENAGQKKTLDTKSGNIALKSHLIPGQLYSNGNLINSFGTGTGGSDESIVFIPLTVIATPSGNPVRLADDFSFNDKTWIIDSISFYDIIPGATPNPGFYSGCAIQIWDAYPGKPGSHVVWGDAYGNYLTKSWFTNVYRRGENEIGNANFPIIKLTCSTPGLTLPAGKYWISWQVAASTYTYSPPCVAPTPESGDGITFDERNNTWTAFINNSYSQGLPFEIYGSHQAVNTDLSLFAITSPVSGIDLGNEESIHIGLANTGISSITGIPVSYSVNGATPVNETFLATINSGDTLWYDFSQKADLSVPGKYKISVSVNVPEDTYLTNNFKTIEVIHYDSIITMANSSGYIPNGLFFDSGNDVGNYQDNEDYNFTFLAPLSDTLAKVSVDFISFDTELGWDFLDIYNGSDNSYPLAASLSGGLLPDSIRHFTSSASNGALNFHFTSDGINNRPGWEAAISCWIPNDNDIQALSVDGDLMPTLGIPSVYKVKIKNIGRLPQQNYQVQLLTNEGTIIGQVTGTSIAYNETAEFTISGTPVTEGETRLYGKVVLPGDQDTTNNLSKMFVTQVLSSDKNSVTVGKGLGFCNYLPLAYTFRNSVVETIYYPEELGKTGTIETISYYYNFREDIYETPVKVWMAKTTKNNFSDGWIPSGELTLVFDSTVSYSRGVHKLDIQLQQPYLYDGGNLVVMVQRPFEYQIYGGDFYGQNTFVMASTPEYPDRTIHNHSDVVVLSTERPRFGNKISDLALTTFTFDATQSGNISGVVYDETGTPKPDVTVAIEGDNHAAITTSNGSYILPCLTPGNYTIKAISYGYDDATATVIVTANTTVSQMLNLTIRPQVNLSGTTRPSDAPWNGLPNCTITMQSPDTTYTFSSDQNGFFLFFNVWGNTTYYTTISHDGYLSWEQEVFVPGTDYDFGGVVLNEITAPPQNVVAIDNQTNASVNWGTASLDYDLIYDDGTFENANAGFINEAARAIKFTPEGYPCTLVNASVNIYDGTYPQGNIYVPFQVAVYDDDGANGFPGTELGRVTVTPTAANWVVADLSSLNITITDGDFYIAHLQGGVYPNCAPTAVDYSNPVNRSYSRSTPTGLWIHETLSALINYMIRAKVSGPSESNLAPSDNVDNILEKKNNRTEEGYNVYRLLQGQENNPDSWQLLATDTSSTSYTDNDWQNLSWGNYRYAIRTYYTNALLSDPAFSNVLPKDMISNAYLSVGSNAGYIPEGATVILTNMDGDSSHLYQLIVPENGNITINSLWKGTYIVEISHRNFLPFLQTIIISDSSTINLQLTEKAIPAYFVNADNHRTYAMINWYNPMTIEEFIPDDNDAEFSTTGQANNDFWMGNKVTTSARGEILNFLIYTELYPDAGLTQLQVDIFDDNHNLLGSSETFELAPDCWNSVNVPNVHFDGNFYAMIHYNYQSDYGHYVGLDYDGKAASENSAMVYDGTTWTRLSDYSSAFKPGAFMIRTTAYTGFNGMRNLLNYDIFRLLNGDENNPDNWQTVTTAISDTAFRDDAWRLVQPQLYKYAVKTNYTSGAVSEAALSNNILKQTLNAGNQVLTYEIPQQTQSTVINYTLHTIQVVMPEGTSLSGLVAQFTLSEGASASINGVEQISGITVNDFNSPVNYTITAENGVNIQNWEVTVTIETGMADDHSLQLSIYPNPAKDMLNISSPDIIKEIKIFDLPSNLVIRKQINERNFHIQIDQLKKGMYMIQLLSAKKIISRKIQIFK